MLKQTFKPFTTTMIGSMPRSQELLELKVQTYDDESVVPRYQELLAAETKSVVDLQERVGIDVLVSGELNRDNYMSFVADHVDGVKLMTMAEIHALTLHQESFEESLEQMDASDGSINNPICVGRIDTEAVLDAEEIMLLQQATKQPVKITLPSPYLLARSMWLEEVTGQFYEDRDELGQDVIKLLINQIDRLAAAGVEVIQIDDPILSEVVFTSASSGEGTSFY